MTVTIHQPCFFPYLGIFKKISDADMLIYYDDAQYRKGYVFERNRMKTSQGEKWFGLPLEYRFGQSIKECRIKHELHRGDKILAQINASYKKADHYDAYIDGIADVLTTDSLTLADAGKMSMDFILNAFGIKVITINASELKIGGGKTKKIVELCKAVGADRYISGPSGRIYLDETQFSENGIILEYSEFACRPYRQLHGEFIPNLSAIDYLLNCGGNTEILR